MTLVALNAALTTDQTAEPHNVARPTDPSGVEVSGRARGGNPELDRIHAEKLPGLLRLGASEVWLSLWCASPRLGRHVKVLG